MNTRRVLFADEYSFCMEEVPAMVWAKYDFAARVRGMKGKGEMSILLFVNAASEIISVHDKICQSNHVLVSKQIEAFIEQYNISEGRSAGFLLVIDNPKQHHKAIASVAEFGGYYPPATLQQSSLFE